MQTVNALDCSAESSPPPAQSLTGKAWLKDDVSQSDWLFKIDDEILQELDQLAKSLQPDTELQKLKPARFQLPKSSQLFKNIRHTLDKGIGLSLIHI